MRPFERVGTLGGLVAALVLLCAVAVLRPDPGRLQQSTVDPSLEGSAKRLNSGLSVGPLRIAWAKADTQPFVPVRWLPADRVGRLRGRPNGPAAQR
jgi:hypothetical protein